MNWVVLDSEDEGEFGAVHKPPLQTHSSISDFSTREIILPETPKADNTSVISEFTVDSIAKVADTTTETIVNASASTNAAPTKPKRPRPRPAYGRVLPEDALSNLSTSIATASTTAINDVGAGPSHCLQSESSFSLDVAEKLRSRKRFATADDAKTAESALSRNSYIYDDTILEGSSKDITAVAGERRRKTQKSKNKSRPVTNSTITITIPARDKPRTSHSVPSPSVNQTIRLPSPVQEPINVTSTPPSSPFQPRRKKRRTRTEDFDFLDDSAELDRDTATSSISVAKDTEPRAKKQKLGKEKKSCVGKAQVATEEDGTSIEREAGEGMEAEIRSHNKENHRSPSPKERTEKNSESTSKATPRGSGTKPQTPTPKMPLRRDSMSALIRRVSSKVQSPLGTPSPAYSPLTKASRTALRRIAPLHPNRRTPPPAPPRPPAPKKSKKMLMLEEKWEEELADTVEGWSCMTDEERAALRRAKRDAELGYDD